MSAPEVKAAGINTITRIVKRRLSPEAFAQMTSSLSPEAREVIEHPPLPVAWLPLAVAAELDAAVARAFGNDLDQLADIGREQMREDLGGIYRVFVRLASPYYVANRAAAIYGTYTRNAGAMRKTKEGDRFVELRIEDVPRPTKIYYEFRRGNILGALEVSGVKDPHCEITDGGGTESFAVFHCSWR